MDVLNAPGCYGSGIAYVQDDPDCTSCPFYDDCGRLARPRKDVLRAKFGFDAYHSKRKPEPESAGEAPAESPAQSSTPREPREPGALPKKAMDLVNKLQRGIRPKFVEIALRLASNGATKRDLRRAYEEELRYGVNSAYSHVAFCLAALAHLGWVRIEDDRFQKAEPA